MSIKYSSESVQERNSYNSSRVYSDSVRAHCSDALEESVYSFVKKVYEILETSRFRDIITWNKRNDGFIIKCIKSLEREVLPLYFKHSKFPSFVRQLNMYDFHKTRVKSIEKEFTHQYFKKGDPELLRHIKRKTVSEESQDGHTSKLKTLTNRYNELQNHCKNLEKIAELSIPIKMN